MGIEPASGGAAAQGNEGLGAVRVVPLRRRHLRSVLRIEGQVYPRPWTLGLYLSELRLGASRHYVAAKVKQELVGYAGMMFALDEAHVTTIAVDPRWQGRGVGATLLLHLSQEAISRGVKHMTLEVRVSNARAQELYRNFGYRTEGVRKNYYEETNEDALVMWVHDVDSEQYRHTLEAIAASLAAKAGVGCQPRSA